MLDQGFKLIVAHFYKADIELASEWTKDSELWRTVDTVHIHPAINDSDTQALLKKSEDSSLCFEFLLFMDITLNTIIMFAIVLFIYGFYYFNLKCKIKIYPKIMKSLLCFSIAGMICSRIIDPIFWGGTLDFICIAWGSVRQEGVHYFLTPYHFIFDMKDIYIWIAMVLFVLFFILSFISFNKLSKDDKKELDKRFKNRMKNIFRKSNKQV